MTALVLRLGNCDRLTDDPCLHLAQCAGIDRGAVQELDELAELAHSNPALLHAVFNPQKGPFVVGASRPRAAQALLQFAGVPTQQLDLRWVQLEADLTALKQGYGVPWYPVIDRDSCVGCGICADYCLFSVYATAPHESEQHRVRVVRPLNCKTGCPACARLCAKGALIFPFCADPELNGSQDPRTRTHVDLASVLGDDPMKVLAERRKKRQLLADEQRQKADQDRIKFSGLADTGVE